MCACLCVCAIDNAYKRWWYLPICSPNHPASCLSSYCLTGGNWHSSLMWLQYLCVYNNTRHAAAYLPMCAHVIPKMSWNIGFECGGNGRRVCVAAVCRASVDLKPVIASRHRPASYRETEYRSQIVFCHAVTQREICRISLMDHKLGSFAHVKQSMCHTHTESHQQQNVSQLSVIYIHL